MKKIIFIFIWGSLLYGIAFSGEHSINFGVNYSQLTKSDATPGIGTSFGYTFDLAIINGLHLQTGLSYMTRLARLEDKTIYPVGTYIFVENINVRLGYLCPNISLKWQFKKIPLSLSAGLLACLAVRDNSTTEIIEQQNKADLPYEFPREQADYFPNEHGKLGFVNSSTYTSHLDIGYRFNDIILQVRFLFDVKGKLGPVDGISHTDHQFITEQIMIYFVL